MSDKTAYNEAQLVAAVRKNDRQSMRVVYETYAPMVMGVCRRYVLSSDDADDIVQDTFVKVFSHIDTFVSRGDGSLAAWIRRITINEAIAFLRARNALVSIDESHDLPDEPPPDTSRLSVGQILECVQQLPTIYRTVFNLNVVDGKSHAEIAQMLDIDIRTSATRLSRAKKMLAHLINYKYGNIRQ